MENADYVKKGNVGMKTTRVISLLMACAFLLFAFAACKPGNTSSNSSKAPGTTQAGDTTTGDSGETTDPNGETGDVTGDTTGDGTVSNGGSTPTGNGNNNNNNNNNSSSGGNNTGNPSTPGTTAPPVSNEKMPYFNVKDYGAKGNGTADDAGAIKKAIDAADKANGGIVYLPAGRYLMNAGVDVPMGVTIRGESPATTKKWRKVSNLGTGTIAAEAAGSGWLDAGNFSGTWIIVNHGAGNVDAHATFQMEGNSSIYGLGFVHKDTAPIVSKITVYPPAIAVKNTKSIPFTRDGMTIENIVLLNAYVGIAVHTGNGKLLDHQIGADGSDVISMGRLRVHNVTGGCVFRGIIMKALLDTIDLQDIRFGYTNMEKTYANERANKCADMEWYRADGTNATNLFSFGAKYGILSTPAFTSGSTSMRLSNTELYGQYPIYLTATGQYEIENCTFTTMNFNNLCTEKKFQAMTVIQDTTSVHQPFYVFNKLNLVNKVQSASANDISLYIQTKRADATAMMVFSNITFSGWSPDKTDPVIYYETTGSGYGGSAMFYNCTVKDGNTGNGMLYKIVNVPNGGLQFNACNIPAVLKNNSTNSGNVVWFN